MMRLLHISDIHCDADGSSDYAYSSPTASGSRVPHAVLKRSLAREIAESLKRQPGGDKIDAILVTGDLTVNGKPDGFVIAVDELRTLCSELQIDPQHNLLIVPGNHDAEWDAPEDSGRFTRYRETFEAVIDRAPLMDEQQVVVVEGKHEKVRVIGVNSALIESKTDQGMGFIGPERLRRVLRQSGRCLEPNTISLLCMHHHVLPVSYVEAQYFEKPEKRTSLTLDARATLELCAEYSISLILHGHQHQPSLAHYSSVDATGSSDEAKGVLWVAGAGSCGLMRNRLGAIGKRHFQVISLDWHGGHWQCDIIPYVSDDQDPLMFRAKPHVRVPVAPPYHCVKAERFCNQGSKASEIIQKHTGGVKPNDTSDLYMVYMRVKPGGHARDFLLKHHAVAIGENYANLESIHEIYGHDDLIVKFRASGDRFLNETFLKPLCEGRYSANSRRWYDLISVKREEYASDRQSGDLSLQANCDTRAIKAFVRFPQLDHAELLIRWLWEGIQRRARPESSPILMTGAYIGHGETVVTEYFVPCGGFYSLAEVVQEIEAYITDELEIHDNVVTSIVWASHHCPVAAAQTSERLRA